MIEITEINDVTCVKGTTQQGSMDVYVFLVDGLLVDTGPGSLLPELIPFFETNDFEKVIVTHHHEDHTGGAKWIQDHKEVPIFIHPLAVDLCSINAEYPLYRKIVWGERKAFQAEPITNTFQSRSYKWEAIHIPGHAFDHLAYLNQNTGVLFSGDLYVTPRPKLLLSFESVPVIMESIRKVLTYDFAEIYCCHAGYVANGKEMLKKKLDYMENKSGEIIHLFNQGLTIEEIKEKLLPSRHPIIQFSNHEWDTLHFITSVIAHYEKSR
ncbi:MBL fold metallo-hydrolase [Robertmurraya yapensis]|uniref:MBL fold metallo-hydrolase n=1 Tax=Bacillus yapensis TaxID=2492960 RepID=A0A3S0IHR9_9BACI|nr:MBL fold metallo-hydrolase [Bacillus yapensis]RTR35710.1 MBL fold metallo-hydrolase [Bacillus yapensis]TKS98512.1 MBL fold metallo-hydrolase [Bacillus yapensis]